MTTIKVTKDRTADLLKVMRSLTKTQVLVGVPASETARTPEEGEPEGITNAAIGYIAEFGSPAANIPERPHLIPGVQSVEDRISKAFGAAAKAAIEGNSEAVSQKQHAAGMIAQNAVRAKITDGEFATLSPKTLQKRRSRGRSGEKPLIDTGQYRRSITYVVRPKGK